MICKNCNNEIDDTAKFCPYCGTECKETITESSTKTTTDDEDLSNPKGGFYALAFICLIIAIFCSFGGFSEAKKSSIDKEKIKNYEKNLPTVEKLAEEIEVEKYEVADLFDQLIEELSSFDPDVIYYAKDTINEFSEKATTLKSKVQKATKLCNYDNYDSNNPGIEYSEDLSDVDIEECTERFEKWRDLKTESIYLKLDEDYIEDLFVDRYTFERIHTNNYGHATAYNIDLRYSYANLHKRYSIYYFIPTGILLLCSIVLFIFGKKGITLSIKKL